jgi:hypothetical protein
MTQPKSFLSLLILVTLSSCIFDSGELWRNNPYLVHWIDTGDSVTLAYDLGGGGSIGRVEAKVVAVGANEKYVVVKQNPNANRAITNYFYIDRAKDGKYAEIKDAVSGPFSELEFEKKRTELALPKFSKEFK